MRNLAQMLIPFAQTMMPERQEKEIQAYHFHVLTPEPKLFIQKGRRSSQVNLN